MGLIACACVTFTCAAKVAVGTDASAATGTGGQGGSTANACPSGPHDADIMELEGKPCVTAEQFCSSDTGCSGCSVTCTNGMWTATNGTLCSQAGGTC